MRKGKRDDIIYFFFDPGEGGQVLRLLRGYCHIVTSSLLRFVERSAIPKLDSSPYRYAEVLPSNSDGVGGCIP